MSKAYREEELGLGQTPLWGCQQQVQPWVPGQQGQAGILKSLVFQAGLLRKLPPKNKPVSSFKTLAANQFVRKLDEFNVISKVENLK